MKVSPAMWVIVGIAGISIAVGGCTKQTVVETIWELPGYSDATFREIAVIAVFPDGDSNRTFEATMTREFEKAGARATPGFTILDESVEELTRAEMERRIEASGVDAVLISKVIAVDRDRNYVPPTTYVTPPELSSDWWSDAYWGYYHPYPYHYWGYWHPANQVVASPGYWSVEHTYRIESALYRAGDHRLVWTAISRTFDPDSKYELANSLAPVLIERLRQANLIPEG